jgi:hypothetical protein
LLIEVLFGLNFRVPSKERCRTCLSVSDLIRIDGSFARESLRVDSWWSIFAVVLIAFGMLSTSAL